MKFFRVTLMFFLILFSVSCGKEAETASFREAGTATFVLSLNRGDEAVRSTISTTDWKVSWAAGDEIYYYTLRGSTVKSSDKYIVPGAVANADVPVNYTDGDDGVVFVTKGTSIGDFSSKTSTDAIITDGVPSSQDGTFESCHIAEAKANLLALSSTKPNVSLACVQSFLKFKMSNLSFGGKTVNNIKIAGGAGTEKVCGNVKVTFSTGAMVLDGTGGTAINVNKTTSAFFANENYYVAIMPGTYSSGITFTLQNISGSTTTDLAKLYVKNGSITISKGKVLELGDLWDVNHKEVLGKTVSAIVPDYAAIVKYQTKKFWIHVEPDDFNGKITWSASTGTNIPKVSIKDDGVTETLSDGLLYHMVEVIPDETTVKNESSVSAKGEYKEWNDLTITAKVTDLKSGNTVATKTATLKIGNFVYLGGKNNEGEKVLWGRGWLYGSYYPTSYKFADQPASSSTSTLQMRNEWESGSTYQWGYVNAGITATDRWGTAGKYNADDNKWILDDKDNAAKMCNSAWDIPDRASLISLIGQNVKIVAVTEILGKTASGYMIEGKQKGFTDCYFYWQAGAAVHPKTLNYQGAWTLSDRLYLNVNSSGENTSQLAGTGRTDCLNIRPVKYL